MPWAIRSTCWRSALYSSSTDCRRRVRLPLTAAIVSGDTSIASISGAMRSSKRGSSPSYVTASARGVRSRDRASALVIVLPGAEGDGRHAGSLRQLLGFDRVTGNAKVDAQQAAHGTAGQASDMPDKRLQIG